MHVPDGFLDAPTSIGTGLVAAAAVGVALRGARRELDDRTAPLAGLVAAFVFATQMLNFPVASGTSGHLLGGALAAILVGPYTGLLCMATVFLVQCLLFADGGITALGTNIDLMGVVTVVVGWTVFKALQAVLPKRLSMVAPSAGIAALVSVPVAALGVRLPLRRRRHRGPLTRPPGHRDGRRARADRHRRGGDHHPRDRQHRRGAPRPRVRRPAGAREARARRPQRARQGSGMRRPSTKVVVAVVLLLALVLAGVVSRFASGDPDGLTKVSEDHGFAHTGKAHDGLRGRLRQPDRRSRCPRRAGSGRRPHVRRPPASTGRPRREPRADSGQPARPQAALPRPLAGAPRAGPPEAAGAGRLRAGRRRHPEGLVPGVRRLPGRDRRRDRDLEGAADLHPQADGGRGAVRRSSRCCCRSSPRARATRSSACR